MAKILLVLLWPAGIVVIFGAAALLVRRRARSGSARPSSPLRDQPVQLSGQAAAAGSPPPVFPRLARFFLFVIAGCDSEGV